MRDLRFVSKNQLTSIISQEGRSIDITIMRNKSLEEVVYIPWTIGDIEYWPSGLKDRGYKITHPNNWRTLKR